MSVETLHASTALPSVVASAQALVAIPSVNPAYDSASAGEQDVVHWLQDWAGTHGLEVELQEALPNRPNLCITLRNGAARPHGLFVGHTDTVAVGGMIIAPFTPTIMEGRLRGRGSADMKGPLAAMLHALLRLRERHTEWSGSVTVACVVDEEYLARGIKAFLKQGTAYDFAVVGEPSRLRIVRGCKGCLRFQFEAIGRAAHSSKPGAGRNAIVAMSEAILALDDHFNNRLAAISRPGFGSSTGSVGLVAGGTGVNIVPESCRASVDIRLLPEQSPTEVFAELQRIIRGTTRRVPDITWRFEEPFIDPAFETASDTRLVQTALRHAGQADADIVAYCCDASKIAGAGIPCIILGPGDIAQAHTADESIAVTDIERAVERYAALVIAMMPRRTGT